MDTDGPSTAIEPRFDLVSDGGLDASAGLANDVPCAPFTVVFGQETFLAPALARAEFFERLRAGTPHPTTSQPTPEQFGALFRACTRPVLAVTISSGLSGSHNAADQARALVPDVDVTLHDARTLSGAQSFQVHAAMTARAQGLGIDTAIAWMRSVHAATELFFTIDTLTYLQRGGRIGRVQATLGNVLQLKPVVRVEKTSGTYESIARARTWDKAVGEIVGQVEARFPAGRPLRAIGLYGEDPGEAERLLARLGERRELVWTDVLPEGVALAVHTGPKAVGLAVMPAVWPWEEDEPPASRRG